MQTVLIVVHLLIVLALIGVVLLQRSEGGLGLGGGGGVSGFMTGRGQANALTKATAVLATIFFLTSLALSILGSWTRAPRSIFDTTAPGAPAGQTAPSAGQGGDVLDQLQRMQGGGGGAPAPAPAPEAPAPAAPAVPQSR
jgi:preprotein translocase subunit SecG